MLDHIAVPDNRSETIEKLVAAGHSRSEAHEIVDLGLHAATEAIERMIAITGNGANDQIRVNAIFHAFTLVVAAGVLASETARKKQAMGG